MSTPADDGMTEGACGDHSGVCVRLKVVEDNVKTHTTLLDEGRKTFEKVRRDMLVLTIGVVLLAVVSVATGVVSAGGFIAYLRLLLGL